MEGIKATIVRRQILTAHVIEFTVEIKQKLDIIPGQRILCDLEDEQGPFQRSYSIIDHHTDYEKTIITFAVRLSDHGRGSTLMKKIALSDDISISGIFGNFVVQNTPLPKVFIGTGIGIFPLINMANHCTTHKQLFFSVSHQKDIIYEEKIKNIPGLGYEIFISQESVPGYHTGRIDFIKQYFDPHTEFYLCGKPETVDDIVGKLKVLGYKRIYTEKF